MAGQTQDNTTMERALTLMELSGTLAEDDISEMLADDAVMEDTRSLWAIKSAISQHEAAVPDIHEEWERFSRSSAFAPRWSAPRLSYILFSLSAAAAVALLLLLPWHRWLNPPVSPQAAMQTAVETREVVITSDGGGEVIMGRAPLADIGGGVAQQGQGTVVYENTSGGKAAIHTITIPPGKTFKVVLADGSEVWLNAGSQLTYPTAFGQTRDVELQGEAYFKVRHDASRPFTVRAGGVRTRVLGTEFNVRCMKGQPVQVTLIKGRVNVSRATGKGVVLAPGEDATATADGGFSLRRIDTATLTYWKDGYFYFDDTPLENIMDEIGPWFNVKVVFRDAQARHYRMHVFFNRRSIDEAIGQINMMEKVHVEKQGDTLYVE